jgi:hypothetical protein
MKGLRNVLILVSLAALAVGCETLAPMPPEEPLPWKESTVAVPSYPRETDLDDARLDRPTDPYRCLVDRTSLGVAEDGVVRYTVVRVAPGGARTVRFEGIRCQTGEARLYAYGLSSGAFREVEESRWEPLRRGGPDGYRADLAEFYFCSRQRFSLEADSIRRRLATGTPDTSVDRGLIP